MLRKIVLGCGAISSVLYIAGDVLGTRRYKGYRYADQEFSELTAQGSPTRRFMVTLSVIPYTVLVAAFGGGIWASAQSLGSAVRERAARVTGVALVGYAAVGAAGGGLFPMSVRGTRGTLRNFMHIPATAVMSLFLLLAMGTGSRLLGQRYRYYTYGTIATVLAAGALVGTQVGRLAANRPTPWMGLEERVNIYATMLWLAALSMGLLRREDIVLPPRMEKPTEIPQPMERAAQ